MGYTGTVLVAAILGQVPAQADNLSPQEIYEREAITFDNGTVVYVGGFGTGSKSDQGIPYKGKFRKPISGRSFYVEVGRDDLVRLYDEKRSQRGLLGVGAAVVGVVGLGVFVAPLFLEKCTGRDLACNDERLSTGTALFLVGTAIVAVGSGLGIGALLMNLDPVSLPERRELADDYNRKLREKLGLEKAKETPSANPPTEVRFTPIVSPQFTGVAFSARF